MVRIWKIYSFSQQFKKNSQILFNTNLGKSNRTLTILHYSKYQIAISKGPKSFDQWKQLWKTCINYYGDYSKGCTFKCIFRISVIKNKPQMASFRTSWPQIYYLRVQWSCRQKFRVYFLVFSALKKIKPCFVHYT